MVRMTGAWWVAAALALCATSFAADEQAAQATGEEVVRLPEPTRDGQVSLERALGGRRSVRAYRGGPISLAQAAQVLWAAQGITSRDGKRTAPSAGARYPLELHFVAGDVQDLPPGIYRYRPAGHDLVRVVPGDRREDLAAAARGQAFVRGCAAAIVIAAVYGRTAARYGARAERYVHIEAGCAAENALLQVTALDLGAVTVGAFDDGAVKRAALLEPEEEPLVIIPIGRLP